MPLGATWDGTGTHFRVWSAHATTLTLVLTDHAGVDTLVPLAPLGDGTWHARVAGAGPGTRYAFRADGPFAPEAGHVFNPAKLLLDPYARLIDGPVRWDDRLRTAYRDATGVLQPDGRDSGGVLPRAVVTDPAFDWQGDRHPRTPWHDTVIYECHVKGLTRLHPGVPSTLRGTYLGLASDAVIEHLRALGVTAVQLLPVHHKADDAHQHRLGLTNYWGYATIGYFAPDGRFATSPGRQVDEFREMVRRLHAAGLEVILDVVYNHTGEGDLAGPTIAFRGLDNAAYYRRGGNGDGYYADVTGCGNTLDAGASVVRRLVLDSLRYWVREMHVDGFRFDLASALGRHAGWFDAASPLLQDITTDPVLRDAKLIAEPWDLGADGYQLGRFPAGWAEWNGRYRDTVRRYWRGAGGIGELAARLAGSADIFAPAGRAPQASVNFVTCHDGYTLADLTAYERKHNEANGEENRDGSDWNESRNWGVEGPTTDRRTLAMRDRVRRSLVATLALSAGVPMLSHGDELLRTQDGNNNAYCQDSPLAWVDWTPSPARADFLAFVRRCLALRRAAPALRQERFFPFPDGPWAALTWHTVTGEPLAPADWDDASRHAVAALLRVDPHAEGAPPARGERLWLIGLNGGGRSCALVPPPVPGVGRWKLLLDTAMAGEGTTSAWRLAPHALMLLEGTVTRAV